MTSTTTEIAPPASWLSEARRPLSAMIATNFISLFSNQLTAIAVPWFVLTLTGSATQTGLTAAATLLPSIIMSFLGGAMVDRMSARKMSIFSDIMSGVTVALVPLLYLLDMLTFPLLLLLMFLGAVFDTPGSTARSTMLPALSSKANIGLERVNGVYSMNQALTTLFGAAIAGVLVGVLGAVNVLWLNAIAFGISTLTMLLFVPELGVRPDTETTVIDDIREGLSWLWNQAALRSIIIAAVVVNAVFSPIAVVALPYFAKSEFDSATALGIIMSAFGGGALTGSLLYGRLGSRLGQRAQVLITVSFLAMPMFVMSTLPPLVVAALVLYISGIGTGWVNPLVMTLMMKITPPHMLGRVSGTFMSAAMVASPLGVLIAGPLIASIGLPGTFLIFSSALLLTWITLILSRPLRHLDAATQENRPS